MFDNPQIAQSYVLVSVLKQQKDRIIQKLNTAAQLQKTIDSMNYSFYHKCHMRKQENQLRKQTIVQLRKQLKNKQSLKKQVKECAEQKLNQLRINLNKIKNIRNQIIIEKKNQRQLQTDIQTILNKFQQLSNKLQQIKIQLYSKKQQFQSLVQQKQIGQNRFKQVYSDYHHNKTKYMQIVYQNTIYQTQVKRQSQLIKHLQNQNNQKETTIKQIKIIFSQIQQNIRQKKQYKNTQHKNNENKQKQYNEHRKQCIKTFKQLQQKQDKLGRKIQVCSKMNSQIVMITAQSANIQRDLRFKQHKIQCLQMLMKKLYNCRDKLILHKRNTKTNSESLQNYSKLTSSNYNINNKISRNILNRSKASQQQNLYNQCQSRIN